MSVQPNCEICRLRANGKCPQLDNRIRTQLEGGMIYGVGIN